MNERIKVMETIHPYYVLLALGFLVLLIAALVAVRGDVGSEGKK